MQQKRPFVTVIQTQSEIYVFASMTLAGKPIIIDNKRLFSIYFPWHYIWKVPISQRLPFPEMQRMACDISL